MIVKIKIQRSSEKFCEKSYSIAEEGACVNEARAFCECSSRQLEYNFNLLYIR